MTEPLQILETRALAAIGQAEKAVMNAKAACIMASADGDELMDALDTAYTQLEHAARVMRGGPFDGRKP
jgi:hypothetical protein